MTRINCVPESELTGPHLVAEYRELPRIFGLVERAIERGERPEEVSHYTLGKGHCRFFYARLKYLSDRHEKLVAEMQRRGYKPNFTANLRESFSHIPDEYWHDWVPDRAAIAINRSRIVERLGVKRVLTPRMSRGA